VKGKSSQEKEMSRERVLKRNRCQGKDVKSQKDGKKKKSKDRDVRKAGLFFFVEGTCVQSLVNGSVTIPKWRIKISSARRIAEPRGCRGGSEDVSRPFQMATGSSVQCLTSRCHDR